MALFLELDPGDTVRIGSDTLVRIEAKSGKRTRLRIESTADVKHVRGGESATAPLQRAPAPVADPPAAPEKTARTTPTLRRFAPA